MAYHPYNPPRVFPFMVLHAMFYKNVVDHSKPPAPLWFKDMVEEDFIYTIAQLIINTAYTNIGNYNYMLNTINAELYNASCQEAECMYIWMSADVQEDKLNNTDSLYATVLFGYFNDDMARMTRWIDMIFKQLLINMLGPILDIIYLTMDQGYIVSVREVTRLGNSATVLFNLEDISYAEPTDASTYLDTASPLSGTPLPF